MFSCAELLEMARSWFALNTEIASNEQLARYLYYTGRIKAVQLEYTDAFRSFFFSFITLEPRVE